MRGRHTAQRFSTRTTSRSGSPRLISRSWTEQKVFPKPIVTEVTPLKAFYRAEDYHQDYAYYNPDNPYIQVCDRPKIEALRKQFPELFVDYKPRK